jgi:hypothetical protein
MRIPDEEWLKKGAKGAKKRNFGCLSIFEPFALFCGQNAFLLH